MKTPYYSNLIKYKRRLSDEVLIGDLPLGGTNPVRVQTMTNTKTQDIESTVQQILKTIESGTEYIRITVPTVKDAENLKLISDSLKEKEVKIPVIADIHFNPKVARLAAKVVDKIRVNPGNFVDNKKFNLIDYTDEEYAGELDRVREELLPLLEICKNHNTALRIGTNHGSLSDRILSRYGDTPQGMAESSMEFLRICKESGFNQVVISMKASNTRIMVQATRLLVQKMHNEGMNYPVHLGVTEAGEGEDGRIKSAVGIGALLHDGIGDTIRVSLTEDPELEIPVAKKLVKHIHDLKNHEPISSIDSYPIDPFSYARRETKEILNVGCKQVPVVISNSLEVDSKVDYVFANSKEQANEIIQNKKQVILPYLDWSADFKNSKQAHPMLDWESCYQNNTIPDRPFFLTITNQNLTTERLSFLGTLKDAILVLETNNINGYIDQRAAFLRLISMGLKLPVIIKREYQEQELEDFQVKSSADIGGLFLDGLGDGLWLSNMGKLEEKEVLSTAFGILQASRVRVSKTEYISCPSCGRTMFNLQETTQKIREKTIHLTGLKIGIMGCIVNGPGEMADADYGYVGAGLKRITLYKGKEVVKRGVPEEHAVEELISLIKENGDWVNP